jgi:RNase P subunit RPR2
VTESDRGRGYPVFIVIYLQEQRTIKHIRRAFNQYSINCRHCRPRALWMALHQLAIPLALHSISPALSAFHINRARRCLRSGGEEEEKERDQSIIDLAGTHCPRCRRFQLDGSADTRLVRDNKHRTPSSVILQKTCRSCGFTRRTPLLKPGAAVFQNRRKRNRQNLNLKPPGTKVEMERKTQSTARETQSPSITPVAQPPHVRDGPKKTKNRKARSGLQEMLERKRKQDQTESAGTSLASFLQGL